ncbi:MAG: amino acid transporter, partial [Alphaproteobacteria bacterium]|nr:amino acid transporter [Alphaproteobacteria bacterium]
IVPGMFQAAGTGALLALLVAILICVATGLVYAELASAWPVAGGEYVFVAHTIGPAAGFVMLGVNLFNTLLFPPVVALGIASVASSFLPGLPKVPLAVLVLAASTIVALLNIRVNALVTGLFLAVELIAIAVVTGLGLEHWSHAVVPMLSAPMMPAHGSLVPMDMAGFGVAISVGIFALNGAGCAVYFAEELSHAPRQIAKAVMAATLLVIVTVCVPMIAGLAAAPDLRGFLCADDPFGLFTRTLGGGRLAAWTAGGIVLAIINAIIASILATARIFYGTARDRCWGRPLDPWFAEIHPRLNSPWIGTLVVGAIMVAACLIPLRFLLLLSGVGLAVIYAGIAASVLVGRYGGASRHAPYRMRFFPLPPVLTLLAVAFVVWASWQDSEQGRPALLATVAQVVLSLAYYWLVLRRRGEWTVVVPSGESTLPE